MSRESWVLSPNSANPTVIKGISRSLSKADTVRVSIRRLKSLSLTQIIV